MRDEDSGATLHREAVIYLPGAYDHDLDDSLRDASIRVASRIAGALDQHAGTREVTFRKAEQRPVRYGERQQAELQTLERVAPDSRVEATLHVFVLDHLGEARRRQVQRTHLQRLVALLFLLVGNAHLPLRVLFHQRGIDIRTRQIVLLTVLVGSVSGYVLLTAATLIVGAAGFFAEATQLPDVIAWVPARAVLTWLTYIANRCAVPATTLLAVAALLPSWIQARAYEAITSLLCAIEYSVADTGRSQALHHVPALLETLKNRGERYDRIHVVGYSFGAWVAVESLFTRSEDPPPACAEVHSLTTIGLPLQVLTTLWPDILGGRRAPRPGLHWHNASILDDPLGTADLTAEVDGIPMGDTIGGAQWGVERSVGALGSLCLLGLPLHQLYWDAHTSDSNSCYHPLVRRIFLDSPLMD
ncbi:MAG: hypothetical protein R3F61_13750 [Myxococcota bacterium]